MTIPPYPVLERVAAASKRPVHIVRAGRAADCGEKINNLRAAIELVGKDVDVFVFADSDGRPNRRWLSHLIAPLADEQVGASTTFRWLLPNNGGFWSAFASAWNAPIVTYLGDHSENFCWGGGTAIRQARFEEVHVREAWHGSVSDDFSLTQSLKGAGYSVVFVPECLVPSPTEMKAASFFEFTTRQIIITRVYAPKLWMRAGIAHLAYCTAVILGLGLFARGAAMGQGSSTLHFLILALLPPILAAMRGLQRLTAVVEILPESRQKLINYAWIWTVLAPLVPFVALYNAIVAAFRRKITWRGRKYELISVRNTRVIVP